MNRRYVLHPGPVKSRNDGQVHYISAAQLADRYGVSLRECITYPQDGGTEGAIKRRLWRDPVDAVHLYPRHDGNYQLPGDSKPAKSCCNGGPQWGHAYDCPVRI